MPLVSSYLPSILALGTLLLVSLALTVLRPHLRPEVGSSRFFGVAALTILAQALHFLEELQSRFSVRLPETFGLPPLDETVFVSFNVAWLAIWVVALFGVRRGLAVATCPLWFLALGMMLNLIAHPVLAMRAGGYFPGLLTSPLVGLLGIFLILELLRGTSSEIANAPGASRTNSPTTMTW